jgi:DNA-binding transcriptional MerR regulator
MTEQQALTVQEPHAEAAEENASSTALKKTYYSISEVCTMAGLEPHVLRYWESEFPQLRPKKNRAGNRAYRDKDIELIEYIKKLLYEEQYTIPGARKKCAAWRDRDEPEPAPPVSQKKPDSGLAASERREIIGALREILDILKS